MGIEDALTKKVGKFPVWVWGVAGISAVGIGLYLRNRSAGGEGIVAPDLDEFGDDATIPYPVTGGTTFEAPPSHPPGTPVQPPPTNDGPPEPGQPPWKGRRNRPERDSPLDLVMSWRQFRPQDVTHLTREDKKSLQRTFTSGFNISREGGPEYSAQDFRRIRRELLEFDNTLKTAPPGSGMPT